MCSSTNLKGPRLVRFAVPCAQTTVAIEMHSRTAQNATCFERPVQQATEPRAKQEMRSVLCHNLVVDSTEREHRHCSGEFEQPASKGVVYEYEVILWY